MALNGNWHKSSYSGDGGDCLAVRVSSADGMIETLDTKDPQAAPQRYTEAEWRAFINGVRDGEFDLL